MGDERLHSADLQGWLERIRAGDRSAQQALLEHAGQRLERLARKMLHRYPSLRRWVETGDVLQNANLRLLRSLKRVPVDSAAGFFGLAAVELRRELIDLSRHFFGKLGVGANHASDPTPEVAAPRDEPADLEKWCAFHQRVEHLPAEQREIVNLLFYQGLAQADAAQLLDVSVRTVQRRWQTALVTLHDVLESAAQEREREIAPNPSQMGRVE